MQINNSHISRLPRIKNFALSESNQDSIIYELLTAILYWDISNISMFNSFLQTLHPDIPVIEDAQDIILLLRALDNQNYKDEFIRKIDDYSIDLWFDIKVRNLFILLNKASLNLEDLDTLKLANNFCINNGYWDGRKLNVSQNILDLISNEFSQSKMIKDKEYGDAIIEKYKKQSISKIVPVVVVVTTLVVFLLN